MTTLRIAYTAPNTPELGQQAADVTLDGSPSIIEAVCQSELTIDHPPGQRLRLLTPSLQAEDTEPRLVVFLPNTEQLLDLTAVAQPSQAKVKIKITIKRENSKPDPPRQATFRRHSS